MLKLESNPSVSRIARHLAMTAGLSLALGGMPTGSAWAQPGAVVLDGVGSLMDGVDAPFFEARVSETEPSKSIDPVMAQGALNHAKVNRLRTMTGSQLYTPTTVCDTDVDIGAGDGGTPFNREQVYIADLVVLSGGACPASRRNR